MFDEKQTPKSISDPIKPPQAVDVLARLIEQQNVRSAHIPRKPFEAAHWWIDHQESPDEWRERMEPIIKNNQTSGWKTPYIDRLVGTLRIFLALSEPHKAFVIQKIEQGIPWRGDDIKMYQLICDQEEIMARDPEGYKRIASKTLQGMKAGAA